MLLYVQELKKVLRCKSSWFVIIAIMVMQVATVFSSYYEKEAQCGNIAEYNTYVAQYNGTLMMDMVDENDIQKMQMGIYQSTGNTKEDYFYERYLAAISRSIKYKDQYNDGNELKYWNCIGINELVQNIATHFSTIFVFIGLIVGLHPLFLKDIENGMDKVIYTSYHGRNEILRAKCIAGIMFEVLWVTVYYLGITLLTIIVFKNEGALVAPISYVPCLFLCRAQIKVWQYLIIGYLLHLIASTFMTACMMVIYARVKKVIVGIGMGLVFTFMPMFIPKNGNIGTIFCLLPTVFGGANLIIGENLKINCLGTEISVLGLGCILLPIGTVLIFLLLKRIFWNGRVEL